MSKKQIMNQTDAMARAARAKKVTWVGFWVNVVLSVAKIIAGIVGRSGAMIADGVHSISDFVTDIIVIVFIGVSAKGENTRFRYGHGKFETFATMLISFALFAVAVGLFWTSFSQIVDAFNGKVLPRPEMVALVMAFVSVVAKEWLFHYTRVAGEQMNSMALVANAWHHRSDAFSSIAVLVGIGCAMFLGERWRVLDPIAAATVSVFIALVAYRLAMPSIRELLELLEAGGYLQTDPVHGGVDTTPQAAEVLFHSQRVEVSVKRQPLQDQPARGRAKAKAERPKKAEDDLLAALKALRLRLSQEQHIPAYIICTNATLLDMAARRPRTIEELLEVSGIGQAKAERFGDAFLKELEHYEQTHGRNAP